MLVITGTGASQGVAIGPLHFLAFQAAEIRREKVADPEAEAARFEQARLAACTQLDELYRDATEKVGMDSAAIFDIHRMMLEDLDYRESILDRIHKQGLNAEYAVSLTAEEFSAMFSSMDDEYMKERAADVHDISERLQQALNPQAHQALLPEGPSILAALDIRPSEAVQLDKDRILGFATVEGSAFAHTAILARSMLLPAVVGMGAKLDASLDGKPAILDGFSGTLYIDPDDATKEAMQAKLRESLKRREDLRKLKDQPSVTADGTKIEVFANVNHISGLDEAADNAAEGIGLFRSEFLFLESKTYPTEEEQFAVYKKAAAFMQGKKVVIRTLDIGADKQAGYFHLPDEANPALGLRAIRLCLTRPEVFKTQLRALYRASAFGNIAIMFPMIISVEEVRDIRSITEEVMRELKEEGVAFNAGVERGIMIETPAAVMISDELAQMVDFFSIGTNDLTQYTLAIDREHNGLSHFYNPHHPAVLKMIEITVKAAHAAGIWAGICGELGADLALTETFLRMGVDELSVSPGMILPLKEKIIQTDMRIVLK